MPSYTFKILTIFSTLVFFCQGTFGQFVQNKSIEIPQITTGPEPEYYVTPLQNSGFLLQERNESIFGRKADNWITRKFDTQMNLVWMAENTIEYNLSFISDFLASDKYYQLFGEQDETNIKILQIDLQTGENQWFEGHVVGIQEIDKMKVIGSMVFLSGKYQGRAVVMGLSLFDKTIKTLKGFYSNHTELVEIDADTVNNHLLIYSKNRYKGACILQLHTYNTDGTLLATTELESETRKMPFNGRQYNLGRGHSLIIGNYARFCENYSQGLFVKKIEDFQTAKSSFIDFSEFKNFFNYLNPKRQDRIQKRISKKKMTGKSLNFNYKMLVHPIQKYDNELIVVAEIYYTEARNNSGMFYSPRGFSYLNYKYTHTIVCAFDDNGNLLWDNCLPMKQLTNTYLNEQVQLSKLGDNYLLAYPEDGSIKTQLIDKNQSLSEREVFKIIQEKDARWNNEDENGFAAWYDQSFLVWGYKYVLNTNPNTANKKIFIINKLTYQPQTEKVENLEGKNKLN